MSSALYPTRRAVLLTAFGAPVALIASLAAPALWTLGPVWVVMMLALMGLDAWLGPSPAGTELELDLPHTLSVAAEAGPATLMLRFPSGRTPARVEAAIGTNAKLAATPARLTAPVRDGAAGFSFRLAPVRRGDGRVERVWARWTGPLGLTHLQTTRAIDRRVPVTLDLGGVKTQAMRLFTRDALHGLKSQVELGDGTEFHALREYQAGHDLRTIDWKRSARHGALYSKEFRSERNHPVILAVDSGRLMSEPVAVGGARDGAPKLDVALNAALLLAYVSLKLGDRVGLFAFDARPTVVGRSVAGVGAFPLLQHLAAKVDYSTAETNFTLGLTALGGELDRRALVVVFTDFADPTSAELMLENTGRLLKRHRVLFVILQDETLAALTRAEPAVAADVSRAVVADALLREREVVVARLRRMGAEIVEAPAAAIGPALIDRYLTLKRRDRL